MNGLLFLLLTIFAVIEHRAELKRFWQTYCRSERDGITQTKEPDCSGTKETT